MLADITRSMRSPRAGLRKVNLWSSVGSSPRRHRAEWAGRAPHDPAPLSRLWPRQRGQSAGLVPGMVVTVRVVELVVVLA